MSHTKKVKVIKKSITYSDYNIGDIIDVYDNNVFVILPDVKYYIFDSKNQKHVLPILDTIDINELRKEKMKKILE